MKVIKQERVTEYSSSGGKQSMRTYREPVHATEFLTAKSNNFEQKEFSKIY
jgi:hypothetical protein